MIVDTGPLVAAMNAADRDHDSCKQVLSGISAPLVTVWPVFTEAMHLLRGRGSAQDDLWQLVVSGIVQFASLDDRDIPRMRELMAKYRDLPMDLADAAIVRLAERVREATVFTLDRRHFSIYRPQGLGRFEIVP